MCDEQCSLHGGVCDNGVCEFRCSDYAGYSCQNSSTLLSSLSVCKNVLESDISGQHCAPSEPSILQQLEEVVVMPNYHCLFPGGARKLFNIFGSKYCDAAAKRLACWVSSFPFPSLPTFFINGNSRIMYKTITSVKLNRNISLLFEILGFSVVSIWNNKQFTIC